MNILYLAVFLLCFYNVVKEKRDFFSPANIFILIYSALLFINSFGLSRYQAPWSPTTAILFFGASGLFLSGILIVRLYFGVSNAHVIGLPEVRGSLAEESRLLDWDWFSKWIYVAGAIFLLGFLEAFLRAKQLPIVARDPNEARLDFILHSRIFVHAWLFGPPTLMLCFEYLLLSRLSLGRKLPVIIVGLIVALAYLSLVTRADLYRFLLFALLLYHYTKRRISGRILLLSVIIAMVIFIAFILLRVRNPI